MSDPTESRLREEVAALLAARPPQSTDPKQFWAAQFDHGLAWVDFPQGLGGLGMSPRYQRVVDDALFAAGAPSNLLVNFMGVRMGARTLIVFGTEEQQRRYLRPLFSCEEIWCQMFSEPGAGSDLAALSTRAVREGDDWVLNGQKVWTTQAHVARWGLMLARTDPEKPKHKGITYFIADMLAPGVEVRPLRQITGEAEFNEVYFTDVRIPDSQRIGAINDGWRVALTTLMAERSGLGELAKEPRGAGLIRHAVRVSRERDGSDPVARDHLARLWVEAEVVRLTGIRALHMLERGTPGPEGAILKTMVSELNQEVFGLCLDMMGPRGMAISNYDFVVPEGMGEAALGSDETIDLAKAFLTTRGSTIGGGTTEIAKNVMGERVLGLPAEPRTDKDLPWSQVPRS